MTTLVCRVGTPARLLIRSRRALGHDLWAGTITEENGRPVHRVFTKGAAQVGRTAPVRLAPRTPQGLTELLVLLDADAETWR